MNAPLQKLPAIRPPATLDVFLLSKLELQAALGLQRIFAEELRTSGQQKAILLLCEHPPCQSRGTGQLDVEFASEVTLAASLPVNRSGGLVEHGPTQLAILPVLNLTQMELSAFGCRRALEQLVANLCLQLGVPEVAIQPGLGVSCRTGLIARTALQIEHNISQLGMYLNVTTAWSLTEEMRSSSIEAATMRRFDLSELKSGILSQFESWLDQPTVQVFTSHPLLKRKSWPDSSL